MTSPIGPRGPALVSPQERGEAGIPLTDGGPSFGHLFKRALNARSGLDKDGIRNKHGADVNAIMVSKDDRPRGRVLLAKAQLPSSGRPGFELFEQKQDWGMTDFTQRITYQRALEGELARTIGGTTGVE